LNDLSRMVYGAGNKGLWDGQCCSTQIILIAVKSPNTFPWPAYPDSGASSFLISCAFRGQTNYDCRAKAVVCRGFGCIGFDRSCQYDGLGQFAKYQCEVGSSRCGRLVVLA
jgi:hypothetical protein